MNGISAPVRAMNGISAPVRATRELASPLCSPPREARVRSPQSATRKRTLAVMLTMLHRDLRFPGSRTLGNKSVSFIRLPVYGTLLQWPEYAKTW